MELARRLLSAFGSLNELLTSDWRTLEERIDRHNADNPNRPIRGIGHVKCRELAAAFALGARALRLSPEDVKRHILLKDGVRYLVMLLETSRGEEIPRGCFFVNSWDGYVFEITEFYVQERYRRKRLGKKMFAAFLRRFRRDCGTRGARITLSVALGNDAAEEFYRQLGFTAIAKDMAMIVGKGKE